MGNVITRFVAIANGGFICCGGGGDASHCRSSGKVRLINEFTQRQRNVLEVMNGNFVVQWDWELIKN